MLAFREALDVGKSAEKNIDAIIRAMLRELEKMTKQQGLEDDWASGKNSTFRTPQENEVRSGELALDFERLHGMLSAAGLKACVICIDEGQRIHPLALSALKNSLQSIRLSYMIALSLINDTNSENEKTGRVMLNELASRSGDPGASRFFQNTTPLGPFDTWKEAENCVTKRLENNIIKFAQPVITNIAHIMGRHPSKMIVLANRVYELTKDRSQGEAQIELVREAFLMQNSELIREAEELRENSSRSVIKIYHELAKYDVGIRPVEIAEKLYPTLEDEAFTSVSTSIQTQLDKLCQTKFCMSLNGGMYRIPQPEYAYAIKLTLDES